MNRPRYFKEIIITIIAFFWLLFVATNVNVTLGQTYLWFTGGILFLLMIDLLIFNKNVELTFQKAPGGLLKSILIGLGGWIILLIASVLVLNFIDPTKASIGAVIGLMGAATPALASSKIANWLTFSLAVPFVETHLWGRSLEFFSNLFNIPLNSKSFRKIKFLLLMTVLSLMFVVFHLTAKGINAYSSLTIVFIMMAISLVMIVWKEETRSAIFMHIFANGVASYLALWAIGSLI